jgi:hypothetical protein
VRPSWPVRLHCCLQTAQPNLAAALTRRAALYCVCHFALLQALRLCVACLADAPVLPACQLLVQSNNSCTVLRCFVLCLLHCCRCCGCICCLASQCTCAPCLSACKLLTLRCVLCSNWFLPHCCRCCSCQCNGLLPVCRLLLYPVNGCSGSPSVTLLQVPQLRMLPA